MREKCWGVTQRNEAIVYISPTSCGEITPKCQRKRIFEVRELFTIRRSTPSKYRFLFSSFFLKLDKCVPVTPSTWRFLVIHSYRYEEAWESTCYSSHLQRLWHRLFVETSNAEAHADMYINVYCIKCQWWLSAILIGYYIPMSVFVALIFDERLELPDSWRSSTKRQVRFSYI